MKCQSVATLWSGSPPLHKVTATAAFDEPPTLYTGGSDGSIICWRLSGTESKQEVLPIAMLCGHAAPIEDLNVCFPIVGSGEIESASNVNSISAGSGALISACTDGVLCIWSRGSGHCKCRRKLPPWVGSPSMMSPLPMSRRYVCIACSSAEAAEGETIGQIQNGTTTDRETHHRKSPKCAVVIVDSCTLNIVRTVFHGNLSIGPLRFMAVVPSVEDMKKQSVIMADALGNLQSIAILKGSDLDGEGGIDLNNSNPSNTGTFILADSSHDVVPPVSVTTNGNLLALIFRTHCVFKSVSNGSSIGEISLVDSSLFSEGTSTQVYLVGGMFLHGDSSDELDVHYSNNEFVVWSNTGAAIMYTGLSSGGAFKFEPICEIPAVSHPLDKRLLISFCQVNRYLLRIESVCINVEGSLLWEPHIRVWLICNNNFGNFPTSIMLGEGGFLGDGTWNSCSLSKTEALKWDTEKNSRISCAASSTKSKFLCGENDDGLVLKGRIVSSSMILSEDFYAPYAVVYGFYSGEIEVVRFEMFFQELDFDNGSVDHSFDPHIPERSFSGHTGAILCLAAHRLVETSDERSLNWVLVSGSMDCTIRIWDMDTGNLVAVMHHHVAPVRQIILPPPWTNRPWSDCFLSVGEDACVALTSFGTLRVERMFPGHPSYPTMVAWDSARGYIACLCRSLPAVSDSVNVLYLWDLKTGARERVLRGAASHSMFDHFCRRININSITGNILGGTTSVSSLVLPLIEDTSFSQSQVKNPEKGVSFSTSEGKVQRRIIDFTELNGSPVHNSKGKLPFSNAAHDFSYDAAGNSSVKQVPSQQALQNKNHPIKCSCPFPGIATLKFDLSHLMSPYQRPAPVSDQNPGKPNVLNSTSNDGSDVQGTTTHPTAEQAWISSLEGCLLRFSLSFLHLWNVDLELDKLLINEMNVFKPENFVVASGLQGDRGSLTLTFPGLQATLELWRSSSEFCAMRSLTMVSLAQRMISLSSSSSVASSALAAFYTRNFAEKVPDIKPPLLQLLVSFWQDPSEHVRMAARSLFHCAASRAIPLPLSGEKSIQHEVHSSGVNGEGEDLLSNTGEESTSNSLDLYGFTEMRRSHLDEESSTIAWLESFEMQDWVSCIGGTRQDAMASHIIVAAALVVWYPILVKPSISKLVVHRLMKLVMAMNEKYSSTAAELLAEGMESTWKACIGPEIPDLVRDIFFQIECVSGAPTNTAIQNSDVAAAIRKTLVGILLPSLAMADVTGFLGAIESQIWATASDSPVHLVSLMTLIRIIRASPKPLVPYLDKVVNFILQTMDHGNSVMRKSCLQSSMAALREVVRVFPMVALNETSTRLAIGDAVGDIRSVTIRIYDMQSVTKIKVLDASGPPGLPSLLVGTSDTMINTAISALSFSPDGEGLVAFSEHGLMIRWWSLGTVWWEKLSRNTVPVQCTKLIFVPPWEGFSPNSSRASIMESIIGHQNQIHSLEKTKGLGDSDNLKLLIHNLDLSYRLAWIGERKVELTRHGHELGSFQL